MKLRELAHARTGDKGNVSNISVIAHEPGDYAFLAEHVTAERVKAHFADIVRGSRRTLRTAGDRRAEFRVARGARRRRDPIAVA